MKLGVFYERGVPPRFNPIYAAAFAQLEQRGVTVEILFTEEELIRLDQLRPDADLYLLKSDSELSLSLATALECMGGRVLNSAAASQLAKNKILAAAVMARAGISMPASYVSGHPAQMKLPLATMPLIFKPYRGYHGVGVQICEQSGALPADTQTGLAFAQHYLHQARRDIKLFVIGQQVFGVSKSYSENSYLEAGQVVELSNEIVELALRCGAAFGMDLLGIDVAQDDDGYHVIDVNYLPGYRGVPDAARLIADHIYKVMCTEASMVTTAPAPKCSSTIN